MDVSEAEKLVLGIAFADACALYELTGAVRHTMFDMEKRSPWSMIRNADRGHYSTEWCAATYRR